MPYPDLDLPNACQAKSEKFDDEAVKCRMRRKLVPYLAVFMIDTFQIKARP